MSLSRPRERVPRGVAESKRNAPTRQGLKTVADVNCSGRFGHVAAFKSFTVIYGAGCHTMEHPSAVGGTAVVLVPIHETSELDSWIEDAVGSRLDCPVRASVAP